MNAEEEEREWIASVNGTGLGVEEIGSGAETVVFSPALFANRGMFDAPVAALSDDFRCVRYDHRGQGDSGLGAPQPSRQSLGTEGLYDDAVALLDQLHLDSCHWVGASIGGFVGMRLAARHPDRVRSLVLIGPNVRPLPRADLWQIDMFGLMLRASHRLGRVGAAVHRRTTEQVMRNMFGATFMSDPSRADIREAWRQRYSAQLVPEAWPMIREVFGYPENQRDMLARIQAPTLILVGDNDAHGVAAPDKGARETQEAISGSRLVTIHGAGHIVLIEEPSAATAEITKFIRAVKAV
ncbi:MAG TPA: alpha/beta hydrolase [Dermatophilaceae bacterium]|nr:alpha/beta hydrolase [Dermatophilaceae bacterium]